MTLPHFLPFFFFRLIPPPYNHAFLTFLFLSLSALLSLSLSYFSLFSALLFSPSHIHHISLPSSLPIYSTTPPGTQSQAEKHIAPNAGPSAPARPPISTTHRIFLFSLPLPLPVQTHDQSAPNEALSAPPDRFHSCPPEFPFQMETLRSGTHHFALSPR